MMPDNKPTDREIWFFAYRYEDPELEAVAAKFRVLARALVALPSERFFAEAPTMIKQFAQDWEGWARARIYFAAECVGADWIEGVEIDKKVRLEHVLKALARAQVAALDSALAALSSRGEP